MKLKPQMFILGLKIRQILVIHVPDKQRLGGKRIGLNIHICSCHLEKNNTQDHRSSIPQFLSNNVHWHLTLPRLIFARYDGAYL
jgi:hypothetical protein